MKNNIPNSSSDDSSPNLILEDERSILLAHNYDGIEELNNPMPSWWQTTFYATILFGVAYFAYFTFFGGPTQNEELNADLAKIASLAPAPLATGELESKILAHLKDAPTIAAGQVAFAAKCVACHGDHGQGVIGPNLADKFWIHGNGTPAAILKVVADGVAEKGMPPWGAVLPPEEMTAIVVYVASLQGTNPANPKEPQGEAVP